MRLVVAFAVLVYTSYARRVSPQKAGGRQASDSLETFLFAMSPIVNPRARSSHAVRMSLNDATQTASQAASQLRNYNKEMASSFKNLRAMRDEYDRQIQAGESEKAQIRKQLSTLTDRLRQLDENLTEKASRRKVCEKTLQETEGAYMKIVKSSEHLVKMLKRQINPSSEKKDTSSDEKVIAVSLEKKDTSSDEMVSPSPEKKDAPKMVSLSPEKKDTPREEMVSLSPEKKAAPRKERLSKRLQEQSTTDSARNNNPLADAEIRAKLEKLMPRDRLF